MNTLVVKSAGVLAGGDGGGLAGLDFDLGTTPSSTAESTGRATAGGVGGLVA
jgi:hypothetical protein